MLPVATCLADDHQIFLPDLPGFGDSSHPHEVLDVPGLADALAAWLDAMALQDPVLLDNSFGCQIIVDLAARHPRRIGRRGPARADRAAGGANLVQAGGALAPEPAVQPALARPRDVERLPKCGWVRLFRSFHYSLRDPIEAKLNEVARPALVVRGTKDPICSQGWAEYVAGRLPQGRLELIPDG